MHESSLISGNTFAKIYGKEGFIIVDVGGKNVNGSLRKVFEDLKMKYICVDMDAHKSVDIIVKPGDPLPFEDGTVDIVVSTSCFEHDPCFWITFREMARIVKEDGYIYVNAPSRGPYHKYPGDNYRFYGDAGQALAYWSTLPYGGLRPYPCKVVETFLIHPTKSMWGDFITIWKRDDSYTTTDIVISSTIKSSVMPLKNELLRIGYPTLNQ